MTKVENAGKVETKSGKSEKERSNKRSHKKEKQKPQTKIVIRHLPPTMSEEEFLKQIDPLPPHDFYYFAAADWSLGYDATCRAYITMKDYDDVFLFRDRFDGYVFVDSKGAEYPAIVEFAPFQGLVKNKSRRVDNKVNTIEQEPHYQQFISKLEEEREAAKSECKLEFSLDRKKEEKITSTPLLQYLANKKEKRREESKRRQEEKRRQREEDKEKRKQTQSQPQVTKIISNNESAGGSVKSGNKSASGKENGVSDKNAQPQQHEEGKSTRSQRRAERNQRRREEFERRRQEREQIGKEAYIKAKLENETEPKESANKLKEPPQQPNKSDDGKQQERKEGGKRYSERRERDRNRNRKDKEKEKQKEIEEETIQTEVQTSETTKAAEGATVAGGEAIVSESVLNFIRSVATAKEFVPKHKQQEIDDLNKSSDEVVPQKNEEKTLDTKLSPEETNKSNLNAENDTQTQKQRVAEEQRRIRNKDRPSIAIYQPKPRLRMSEERDTSASRPVGGKSDTRSNPTSDCESLKKEETRGKKVSRYSERRAERRINKEKQRQCTDSIEPEQKKDVTNAVEQPESNLHTNALKNDNENLNNRNTSD